MRQHFAVLAVKALDFCISQALHEPLRNKLASFLFVIQNEKTRSLRFRSPLKTLTSTNE
jgi:hypothetical protein